MSLLLPLFVSLSLCFLFGSCGSSKVFTSPIDLCLFNSGSLKGSCIYFSTSVVCVFWGGGGCGRMVSDLGQCFVIPV
jgi:hypothetical protein